jgi:leucyl aminopeptidase
MIKGRYADIVNSTADRGAGGLTRAPIHHRVVGAAPRGARDIAGTAYDNKKPYTPNGGAGFGVRTLIELARATDVA